MTKPSGMEQETDKSGEGNLSAQSASMPVGAVMVIGGGIAGIQASLDLAEQGFKVYLERRRV